MASVVCNSAATVSRQFNALSEEEQAVVREKQRHAKEKKQIAKKRAAESAQSGSTGEVDKSEHDKEPFSTRISSDEYFGACPRSVFYDRQLGASEASVDLLMELVRQNAVLGLDERKKEIRLSEFQYFLFEGSDEQIWDPTLYAKLAFEGFFTITTDEGPRRKMEPLPELQPFYGVVDWHHFNQSKYVKKCWNKLKHQYAGSKGQGTQTEGQTYHLYCNVDLDRTYETLDSYQTKKHGANWMVKKYLQTMKKASDDTSINFKLHSMELYDAPLEGNSAAVSRKPQLIAGEIGFSIGGIYTSLSGFYKVPGAGTIQLVCLGKWLESKNYAFWSLGHCYSPEMEYKRELGHRVYPRTDFLAKLKQHRGTFRTVDAGGMDIGVAPFVDSEKFDLALALQS